MAERHPEKCPLCLHPDSNNLPINMTNIGAYSCPRCGNYYISDILYQRNGFDPKNGNFALACIAHEYHLKYSDESGPDAKFVLTGEGKPRDHAASAFPECRIFTPDEMIKAFPEGTDILDRALLNLSRLVRHPMELIEPTKEDLPFLLFTEAGNLKHLWNYLMQRNLIQDAGSTIGHRQVTITPDGWTRIQELADVPSDSKQAFVAMWFGEEMRSVYQDAIEPAIAQAGFEAKRIDTVEHNNKICDEIVAEMRRSRFIVADFTGQRGGVYFEAGYAMGMGLPVIWLVHEDQVAKLHFDTRQYNHIVYESTEDLKQKLYNRIAATIH